MGCIAPRNAKRGAAPFWSLPPSNALLQHICLKNEHTCEECETKIRSPRDANIAPVSGTDLEKLAGGSGFQMAREASRIFFLEPLKEIPKGFRGFRAVMRIRSILLGSGSTDPVLKIRICIRVTQKRPDPDPT